MFEVGQQVVCIDDKFDPVTTDAYQFLPTKDEIYVIRDIMPGFDRDESIATGQMQVTFAVTLEDMQNPIPEGWKHEPAFAGRRFAEMLTNREEGVIKEEEPEFAEL